VAGSKRTQLTARDLVGEWKTDTIDTELGNAVIELVFDEEHLSVCIAYQEGSTSVRAEGPYKITAGGYLSATPLYRGRPLRVSLEGETLVFRPFGEPNIRAKRQTP